MFMPPIVDLLKCNGCAGRSETFCEEICPGDLMTLDPASGKAVLRSARDCWDCMSCIKVCPRNALETRLPYQIGYFKASLRPFVGEGCITWVCRDIYGVETTFHTVTRRSADSGGGNAASLTNTRHKIMMENG